MTVMLTVFASIACLVLLIALERWHFFWSTHVDMHALANRFRLHVSRGEYKAASAAMAESPSTVRGVLVAGLGEAKRGHDAALHAVAGAKALHKVQVEARSGVLLLVAVTAPLGGAAGALHWSLPDLAAAGLAVSAGAVTPLVALQRLAARRMAVASALAGVLLSELAARGEG